MRRIILSSVACLALPYFSTLSRTLQNFRKKVIKRRIECVVGLSLQHSTEIFLILTRIEREIIVHVHTSSCEVPRYSCHVVIKLEFSRQIFEKNTQMSNLMKIGPVGAELFHADERTKRQT
jgi:hypothetical protein